MKKITSSLYLLGLFALIGGTLSACTLQTELGTQTANHIARPAFMVERFIPAGNFQLKAWERMHAPYDVATVYIEGEGFYWKKDTPEKRIDRLDNGKPKKKSRWFPSNVQTDKKLGVNTNLDINALSPTPNNPVGLHLASRDLSKNLAYLARPCQFIKTPEKKGCSADYWKAKQFAPEVISAYESALSDMASRYDLTGFHLVGYGAGANIAAVLAAKRKDVLTLRTVAGDLNPDFTTQSHNAMPLASNSVMAVDFGSALANIPQHHFIGAADEIITPGVYHSYRQMVGLSDCVHYSLVQDADHKRGWVERWPELLKHQPQCAVVHENLPTLPPAGDFPGDYHKGTKYSK